MNTKNKKRNKRVKLFAIMLFTMLIMIVPLECAFNTVDIEKDIGKNISDINLEERLKLELLQKPAQKKWYNRTIRLRAHEYANDLHIRFDKKIEKAKNDVFTDPPTWDGGNEIEWKCKTGSVYRDEEVEIHIYSKGKFDKKHSYFTKCGTQLKDSITYKEFLVSLFIEGNYATLLVSNDENFDIQITDFQVYANNFMANWNIDDFDTPTGDLVPGIPTEFILNEHGSIEFALGEVCTSCYILVTGDVATIENPTEKYGCMTAIRAYDVLLEVVGFKDIIGEPDSIVTADFTIDNFGEMPDIYNFEATNYLGWDMEPSGGTVEIDPDGEYYLPIEIFIPPGTMSGTINTITLTVTSQSDPYITSSDTLHLTVTTPPEIPDIDGPTQGNAGTSYPYTFTTIDPDNEEVYYRVYWGDENLEDWTGPHSSGEEITMSHLWEQKGTYTIEVISKDIHGAMSDWAELTVTMPRDKAHINTQFQWFLQQHLYLFPILQHLLLRLGL